MNCIKKTASYIEDGRCRICKTPFFLFFFLVMVIVCAEQAKGQEQPAAKSQQPASSIHSITQAAFNSGALSCASRINQVATFLTSGSQGSGAYLFLPQTEPDRNMLSTSLELQVTDTLTAYASASFAPNQANGCGTVYETVVYWPQKCDEVATRAYSGLKRIGNMGRSTAMLDGGPLTKVFLMPAGSGCVSIKKEILY